MPLTIETVEYDAASRLLTIRNPTLAEPAESSILGINGWSALSGDEVPLTPGHKPPNKFKRALLGEDDFDKENTSAAGEPAFRGNSKRVYRAKQGVEM
jgi:hypothetical protein